MKIEKINDVILALSNNLGDLDALHQILKPSCPNLTIESHEDRYVAAWRRSSPMVLILCFDPIESAKTAYLELLRKAQDDAPRHHQTLLLCNARDMREACALALNELVDDFAVFKPLQLPELIPLKIRQALSRAESACGMQQIASLLQGSTTSFESVKSLWEKLLAKGEHSQQTVTRDSAEFFQRLRIPAKSIICSGRSRSALPGKPITESARSGAG